MTLPFQHRSAQSMCLSYGRKFAFLYRFVGLLLITNLVIAAVVLSHSSTTLAGTWRDFGHRWELLSLLFGLLACLNLALLVAFALLRRHYLQPIQQFLIRITPVRPQTSLRRAAQDFAQLLHHVCHLDQEQHALRRKLSIAQARLEYLAGTHGQLNHCAVDETYTVFETIQAYAQYLEDMVLAKRADEAVRYDYDEVCEAAGNLHFLMQGMQLLLERDRGLDRSVPLPCDVGKVLGEFLVQSTASLERRSMKLTSRHFPENMTICTHEPLLRHLLWAMLFACVRYAEDDSTLHIEGREGESRVELRFFVSHSNPAALSSGERKAYLAALTNSDHSVHMFTHAISQHPNILIAGKLAAAIGGVIDCIPQGPYCCMLALDLPRSGA